MDASCVNNLQVSWSKPEAIRVRRSSTKADQFHQVRSGDRHQAGAHGIQFHVAKRSPEMRIVDRAGIKSPLSDVAREGLMCMCIPVGRITSVSMFEDLRQRLVASGNRDQVYVIRRQTITQQG